jgi:CBS domain-containing protein/sporulation protein YlmC with PRC-barrel domain
MTKDAPMAYLSEIIRREVRDHRNNYLGRLQDVLIVSDERATYPRVMALAIATGMPERPWLLPWGGNEDLAGNKIILQKPPTEDYVTRGHEIWLSRDLLDKQVIDTNDHRIVRVNDLELGKLGTDYCLINVDIGGRGLLRRLGMEDVAEWVARRLGRKLPSHEIAWRDLSFLPGGSLRVNVTRQQLSELHPADIAEILEDVGPRVAAELIRTLDDEKAADTLEELEPEFQAEVLETISDERAADIVEEMQPDEAADLLNEMDEERRADILNLMEKAEKAEVEELLVHDKDTAGGLMNTRYVTIPPGLTAAQALFRLRAMAAARKAETIYYVYITDDEEHLLGVVSLSNLVLADPNTLVDTFMHAEPEMVALDTGRDEVLEIISRYDLLAVPVVDATKRLQGIVTADDALQMILPDDLKVKLPRLF